MVSTRDLFEASGPTHLTSVNWARPDHCRSVVASLVQGVYVLERDRQLKRKGFEACAPAWWKFFKFEPVEKLINTKDSSIFGVIYKFTAQDICHDAPNFVIAFRGTIPKKKSAKQDIEDDLRIFFHRLHRKARFNIAMQAVVKLISCVGNTNAWLAGHSLGSAIAMLAGKNLVKSGIYLETYLFNPPFVGPIECINDGKLKDGLRIAGDIITAGLTVAMKGQRGKSEKYFLDLAWWVPNLFVNKADGICSKYVGYFEQRRKMEEICAGKIGRLATQNSLRALVKSALGKEGEPLELIPSAKLTVNLTDCSIAHGIRQWWSSDLHLPSKEFIWTC